MGIFDKIKSIIGKKEDYNFLTEVSEYDLNSYGKKNYVPNDVKNNELLFFLHEKAPSVLQYDRYFDDWKTQFIQKTHNYFNNYALKETPENYYLDFIEFYRQLDVILSKNKIQLEEWNYIFHYLISKDQLTLFKFVFLTHYFPTKHNKISQKILNKNSLNILFLSACALKASKIIDFLINTEFEDFKKDIVFDIIKSVKNGSYTVKEFNEMITSFVPSEHINININDGEALLVAVVNKSNNIIQVLAKRSDLRLDFNDYNIIDKIIKTGNFNMLKLLHEKFIFPKQVLDPYTVAINNFASTMLSYTNQENKEMIFTYLVNNSLIELNQYDYLKQAMENNLAIAVGVLFKHNIKFTSIEEAKPLLTNHTPKSLDFLNNLIIKKSLLFNELLEQNFILDYLLNDYKTNYVIYFKFKEKSNPHVIEILINDLANQYRAQRISKEVLLQYLKIIYEKEISSYFDVAVSTIEKILLQESSSSGTNENGSSNDINECKKNYKI